MVWDPQLPTRGEQSLRLYETELHALFPFKAALVE